MKNWIKEHESTLFALASALGIGFAIIFPFHQDIDKLESRLTTVENRVVDIDKRLISVETILLMQDSPIKAIAKNEE